MRILVTGGAGFIGSHITDRLIAEGHEVGVVDNLSTGKKKNVNSEAIFYKTDILSPRIERVFKKFRPELISHHAAQMDVRRSVADPLFDAQVNILGLLNILQNGVKFGTKRIIFASSGGAIYGEQECFPASEEHPTRPQSPYGVSKLGGESYLHYYQKNYGLEYTSLRYGNVYGPRQDPFGEAGVVAIFSQRMLRGEQAIIYGNGMQTRDYIYVGDVVEAHMAVLSSHLQGVFNVGISRETTVNHLFQQLREITEVQIKEVHGPERRGEQFRSCLDSSRLQKQSDWEAKVPLIEGLRYTVDYFREVLK
ncbi:MAG TPA: NAD-dependent epimerase/dehydratase family protein [Nitrospiria bacterium]|nr:NAD-dependent epimerase/dehydratase family protein [Nitrospiria bacterium]